MKKILSLFLCLALLLGMTSALAEETAESKVEAYISFASGDWAAKTSFWNNEGEETAVIAKKAEITGAGSYTVGLDFTAAAEEGVDTAFNALQVAGAIEAFPGMCLNITAIRINGESVEFAKGYTNDEEGKTRMNIFNEWVKEAIPKDARSYDEKLDDVTAEMVAKEVFTGVKTMEVDFDVIPLDLSAAIVMASADWNFSYWNNGSESPVVAKNADIKGEGTYTVGLEFPEEFSGLAFAAVKVNNAAKVYPGYFIDVKEVKINGEAIEMGKGYTNNEEGGVRMNLYNEWVPELPADARRADGDMEGVSPMVIDNTIEGIKSIEATFDFIYGEPPVEESATMTEDEAKALKEKGFSAYIGVQGKDTYVFRNAWNDNYGLNDEEHPYFYQLTGWDNPDTADGSDNLGGTFVDTAITGDGEYTVSLTTGERGFGATEAFNMLFVSTNIPSKLVNSGFLTISDVKVKIGSGATQEYTSVNTEEGEYVRIDVINSYAQSEAPFGYTVPGANETITITFTVSGW